jgi:hypothetical protein
MFRMRYKPSSSSKWFQKNQLEKAFKTVYSFGNSQSQPEHYHWVCWGFMPWRMGGSWVRSTFFIWARAHLPIRSCLVLSPRHSRGAHTRGRSGRTSCTCTINLRSPWEVLYLIQNLSLRSPCSSTSTQLALRNLRPKITLGCTADALNGSRTVPAVVVYISLAECYETSDPHSRCAKNVRPVTCITQPFCVGWRVSGDHGQVIRRTFNFP